MKSTLETELLSLYCVHLEINFFELNIEYVRKNTFLTLSSGFFFFLYYLVYRTIELLFIIKYTNIMFSGFFLQF